MTPNKKQSKASFTSLRIIGKKAQRIIEGARKNDGSSKSSQPRLPRRGDCEEVVMHISGKSVLKAAFMILAVFTGAWLVIQVRDKLIILFLAMFIAAVIDPGVEMLERVGIPRGLAVLIQYFVALFLLLFLVVSLIPIIATQLQEIALLMSVKVNTFLANPEISLPLISESVNQQLTVMLQTTLQDLSIDKFTDALQQLGQ